MCSIIIPNAIPTFKLHGTMTGCKRVLCVLNAPFAYAERLY